MKIFLLALAALLLAAVPAHAAKKLSYDALPPAVKQVVDAWHLRDGANLRILQTEEKGKPIYKVSGRQEGKSVKLWIDADGKIIRDNQSASRRTVAQRELESTLGKGKPLRAGDLPAAVQKTLQAEAPGASVSSIRTDHKDGRTIYELQLEQAGQRRALSLDEAGAIVKHNGAMREKSGAPRR